jgi:membrane protein implicated in regulation of membrane protease activity
MFELPERAADNIRFTPLWWIGGVLGAGAIFFLDFVRITWLGGLLCLASVQTIWYASRRSRKLLRRDDHIWTNQENKNEL